MVYDEFISSLCVNISKCVYVLSILIINYLSDFQSNITRMIILLYSTLLYYTQPSTKL